MEKPNFKEEITAIMKQFSQDTALFFAETYKQLKEEGKDNEWIFLALKDKTIYEWDKYRFGLMFNEKFRRHIDYEYNKRHIVASREYKTVEDCFSVIEDD
jgi:hypothetical protein